MKFLKLLAQTQCYHINNFGAVDNVECALANIVDFDDNIFKLFTFRMLKPCLTDNTYVSFGIYFQFKFFSPITGNASRILLPNEIRKEIKKVKYENNIKLNEPYCIQHFHSITTPYIITTCCTCFHISLSFVIVNNSVLKIHFPVSKRPVVARVYDERYILKHTFIFL